MKRRPDHKSSDNHTTLGLTAILVAATLVIARTVAATPAFAGGHKRHYKGGLADGNTLTLQKNKATAISSGLGTISTDVQQNALYAVVSTCV
jgi:hypothetical protein